jgi:uncharacterized protein (TIGR03067 family)
MLKQIDQDDPLPVRDLNPDVPDWLAAIIAKLHARDPRDRFQSAKEVADLLGQHLAHLQQPNDVPMPAQVTAPRKPKQRRRLPVWVIVLIIVLLAGVALVPIAGLAVVSVFLMWSKPDAGPGPVEAHAEPVAASSRIGLEDQPAPNDHVQIHGSWRAVSGERQGKVIPPAEIGVVRVKFTGNEVEAIFPNGTVIGPFTLNPTAEPREITIVDRNDNNVVMKGIYRFDGDRLVLCIGDATDDRPTKFATDAAKPSLVIATFEREK